MLSTISWPLGNWQSTQLFSNYSTFYQMCDTMEGVRMPSANGTNQRVANATVPGVGGIGVEKALPNYAAWFRNEFLPNCKLTLPPSTTKSIADTMESY
jgi:hypothetical protein